VASKIEDYGLIGNCRTAALVSKAGSIDWLCAPAFDSDACFSALLGYDEHGCWSIRPATAIRGARRRYRGNTMVLETELICDTGEVRIIDFMPLTGDRCDIVRIVEGLEGTVPMEMRLEVMFGYGANKPWIVEVPGGLRFAAGPDAMVLRAPGQLQRTGTSVSQGFEVRRGERIAYQLSAFVSHLDDPPELDSGVELSRCEAYWNAWAARCTYDGRWKDAVLRSLLTLKALTYAPTGGIVAAPTSSLPEELGGIRNWDYRFCWLRDASLTIDALLIGGYLDEARSFRDWVLRATAGAPDELQIMYDIRGGRRLAELPLPWLPGYEGSLPVRIGNAASGQFQLDVYGEALSALYLGLKSGMAPHPAGWTTLETLIRFIEKAWQRPDDGIWEVRGGRKHFTHSKVMAWVAIDRALRAIDEFGLGNEAGRKHLPRLRALRSRLHSEVCERGFHSGVGAFTQSYGSETLDASVLLIPHTGFLPATDPRVVSTVELIERELVRDGFVLRYDTGKTADGLTGSEGAFLACSFWLADNLAFAGELGRAEALFERLLSLRNDLGLLAEEYEPRVQRQVGNFPQGFSHLALIMSAYILDRVGRGDRISALGEGAAVQMAH
jgi:GH15 family glucan-1,4-alpha-glucosidase